MTKSEQQQLGKALWAIADQLRGAMNTDDFRDYMLAFLFLRYLSDNYQETAKKDLGKDYPEPDAIGNGGRSPLSVWYEQNEGEIMAFERQVRHKAPDRGAGRGHAVQEPRPGAQVRGRPHRHRETQ